MMSSTQTGRRPLFTPLPENKPGAIRLFKLFPGRGQERIRGSLVTADCLVSPDYKALSYRWESSLSERPTAWIDGRICDVQSNLSHALFALRRPKEHCVLRIYYICIDQLNLDEKSRQVQLMARYTTKPYAFEFRSEFPIHILMQPSRLSINLPPLILMTCRLS